MSTTTTYDRKTAFLTSQTRTLVSLPPLPPTWQSNLPADEHGDISSNIVNQVFIKRTHPSHARRVLQFGFLIQWIVNAVARRHHRLVYSTQALRQVAGQIDTLYWEAAEEDEGGVLCRGVDLRDPRYVAQHIASTVF